MTAWYIESILHPDYHIKHYFLPFDDSLTHSAVFIWRMDDCQMAQMSQICHSRSSKACEFALNICYTSLPSPSHAQNINPLNHQAAGTCEEQTSSTTCDIGGGGTSKEKGSMLNLPRKRKKSKQQTSLTFTILCSSNSGLG